MTIAFIAQTVMRGEREWFVAMNCTNHSTVCGHGVDLTACKLCSEWLAKMGGGLVLPLAAFISSVCVFVCSRSQVSCMEVKTIQLIIKFLTKLYVETFFFLYSFFFFLIKNYTLKKTYIYQLH